MINLCIFAGKPHFMIKSMTGFGKSQAELPDKSITIEIRSLNSKQLDIFTRMPSIYKEKELEIRNVLALKLDRGKIEFTINVEITGDAALHKINRPTLVNYYKELKSIAADFNIEDQGTFLPALLRLPDVLKSDKPELDEQEWNTLLEGIEKAIVQIDAFRINEGRTLEKDFRERINLILEYLSEIEPYEKDRTDNLKKRMEQAFSGMVKGETYDENRMEQELIYYIEKLDITEEKVRLRKHCDYFIEIMTEEESQGKKLGFVVQEIGREINTLGSKANDASIQRIIVRMKDELEKIKEQLMNIL